MKTLKYLFIAALAILSFNACEDVPEPYEIPTINGAGSGSNVSTPEGEGTLESPYNAAGANAYISTLGADENSDKAIYVKGIICNIKEAPNSQYGNATFYISADGKTTSEQFYVFRCHNLENKKFTDNDVLNVGDEVIIYGKVVNYKGTTPETVQNEAYIYSHSATTDKPEEIVEMSVAEAIAAYSGTPTPAAVKGYIVGWVEGQSYESGAKFNGNVTDDTEKTDVLLADSPDETDPAKCIPVQLPSGAVRSKVNLKDNPDNYKKFVTLTGIIEAYFGVPGLKSVTKALFEGEEDSEDTPVTDAYINETFASSFGTFTTAQTVGNYPWVIDYSCAKVTAYDSASKENNAAESWLVSPAIDFSKETEAYITFDYVVRYTESGKVKDYSQLLISNDYTDDVATATWTAIDYNVKENTADWTFYNTGKIAIPVEFMGKENVRIAFKYTSSATKAGTWEVKNVVVAKGAAGTPETPETPETPAPAPEGTIAAIIAAGEGNATANGTVIATYARGFLLSDETGCILVYLGEDKGFAVGDVVTVSGTTSVYGGLLQFGNSSTATKTGSESVSTPTAVEMNGAALDAYISNPVVKYVQYKGVLSISNYYNVNVDGASTAVGSIAYPKDGVVDASLNGKEVIVTGYVVGVSGTRYISTMATSIVAANPDDTTGGEEEGGDESGSTEDTTDVLTVEQLIAAYNSGTTGAATVTGYIVGTSAKGTTIKLNLGTENAAESNLVIADNPNETDSNKCIVIELKDGSDIRKALNLVSNPEVLGKKVNITGQIQKYFGKGGIKNATAYTIE